MKSNGWFLRMTGMVALMVDLAGCVNLQLSPSLGSQGTLEEIAITTNLDDSITANLGGGVTMDFVLIRPGSFTMGRRKTDNVAHKVTITKPFYMGRTEVTQEQWGKVMGNNPSDFKGPNLPVERVNWYECQGFMDRLREKATGLDFRLPTEAQWEYACRAGSTTDYSFGDVDNRFGETDNLLGEYAWYRSNAGRKTHEVGGLKPNAWGLYDMHGNVWEWCSDWYGNYTSDNANDPLGPTSASGQISYGGGYYRDMGSSRVLRGGSWINDAGFCCSENRDGSNPYYDTACYGFRVVGVPR